MDQIYGNAFITLAAAGASNVSEGILTAESEFSSESCSIPSSMTVICHWVGEITQCLAAPLP
jgi:hypothetical protein